MVSIEQIAILEQKVVSAVARIAQLTAENDALRSKCVELTNALSAKTEQLSAFQTDQNKIEVGIMKALEQLKTLEGSIGAVSQENVASTENRVEEKTQVEEKPSEVATQPQEEATVAEQTVAESAVETSESSAEEKEEVAVSETVEESQPQEATESVSETKQIFDIF